MNVRLMYGVSSRDNDESTLNFIKFFDKDGLTGEISKEECQSFIEIYQHNLDNDNTLVAGITLMMIMDDLAELDNDAYRSAEIIFNNSIREYKAFLNKNNRNDTFNLSGKLMLFGVNSGQ